MPLKKLQVLPFITPSFEPEFKTSLIFSVFSSVPEVPKECLENRNQKVQLLSEARNIFGVFSSVPEVPKECLENRKQKLQFISETRNILFSSVPEVTKECLENRKQKLQLLLKKYFGRVLIGSRSC